MESFGLQGQLSVQNTYQNAYGEKSPISYATEGNLGATFGRYDSKFSTGFGIIIGTNTGSYNSTNDLRQIAFSEHNGLFGIWVSEKFHTKYFIFDANTKLGYHHNSVDHVILPANGILQMDKGIIKHGMFYKAGLGIEAPLFIIRKGENMTVGIRAEGGITGSTVNGGKPQGYAGIGITLTDFMYGRKGRTGK